jgi:hypothetical protein
MRAALGRAYLRVHGTTGWFVFWVFFSIGATLIAALGRYWYLVALNGACTLVWLGLWRWSRGHRRAGRDHRGGAGAVAGGAVYSLALAGPARGGPGPGLNRIQGKAGRVYMPATSIPVGGSLRFYTPSRPEVDETALKRSTRVDPIRARKLAFVDAGEHPGFVGIGRGVRYSADDVALCAHGFHFVAHEPPELHCGCGFYAQSEPDSWDVKVHAVSGRELPVQIAHLDVELYGRVIRHERGWRAQRQRVLAVVFAPTCPCGAHATVLSSYFGDDPMGQDSSYVWPVCDAHRPPDDAEPPPAPKMVEVDVTTLGSSIRQTILAPAHAPAAPPVTVTLAELANLLATEVRWSA